MNLLLLSRDLMLSSRAEGAARKLGMRLVVVGDLSALEASLADEPCGSVLVDLRTPGLAIEQLVTTVRQQDSPPPIVAFGPHVHEASLSAARDAGCDVVLTRGQFDRELEQVLASLLPQE